MQEFITRAIVLQKQPLRDLDGRYIFFSERFGKFSAKAKSSRKITSKLAPHLEPGNLIKLRFIEMNGEKASGTQIVDALKESRLVVSPVDLRFLSLLIPDAEPEPELWQQLTGQPFSWKGILKVLGWDPQGAICAQCGAKNIVAFYLRRQEFFCAACASKLPPDEVLFIDNGV